MLDAIARNVGHTLAFDIVTRERMVAISVAAHKGDSSGVRRMFDEILDPRQVEAMRKALGFLGRSGAVQWNDLYIATTRAGQEYNGTLVGRAGSDFMLRTAVQAGEPLILIGDTVDLPAAAASGDQVRLHASQFLPLADQPDPSPAAGGAAPPKAKPLMMGKILDVMRPAGPTAPLPWDPPPAPLTERIRTFEKRLQAEKAPASKPEDKPGPDPDETPRPRSGPKP